MAADTQMRLEPWDNRGLDLERRANIPEMKTFLGGPEPDATLVNRHERILATAPGAGRMFLIMVPDAPDPVGSVGYWEKEWGGDTVYEMGWQVLPGFQGRGLAVRATVAAIGFAAAEGWHPWAHAYPKVDNAASNSVCRKAGFTLLGECDFEFPKGNPIVCNDWRYALASPSESDAAESAASGSAASGSAASGSGSTSSRA
jgi:RimJ/RimL family protein N-acetyltransferase